MDFTQACTYSPPYVKVRKPDSTAPAGMPLVDDNLLARLVLQGVAVGRRLDLPGTTSPLVPNYPVPECGGEAQAPLSREFDRLALINDQRMLLFGLVTVAAHGPQVSPVVDAR